MRGKPTISAKAPSTARLIELAAALIDEGNVALGPLDREDLREALCELIDRRNVAARYATAVRDGAKQLAAEPDASI